MSSLLRYGAQDRRWSWSECRRNRLGLENYASLKNEASRSGRIRERFRKHCSGTSDQWWLRLELVTNSVQIWTTYMYDSGAPRLVVAMSVDSAFALLGIMLAFATRLLF